MTPLVQRILSIAVVAGAGAYLWWRARRIHRIATEMRRRGKCATNCGCE